MTEGLPTADRLQAVKDGGSDGEELSQDRKKGAPENCREGQTLLLRQVPQKKPETCQDPGPVVLSEMLEPKRTISGFGNGVMPRIVDRHDFGKGLIAKRKCNESPIRPGTWLDRLI